MNASIPNILSAARLLTAPVLAIMVLVMPLPQFGLWAAIVFAIAAVTDFLDGYIARRFDLVSELGKVLDRVADKVLVVLSLMILVTCYGDSRLVLLSSVVIAFRELFVTGLREHAAIDGLRIPSSRLGKTKAAVQMAAVILLFCGLAATGDSDIHTDMAGLAATVGMGFLVLSAVLALASGCSYFASYLRRADLG